MKPLLIAPLALAFALLVSAPGGAHADEWFVLSESTINSADQGVELKSDGNRWAKDVKQVKISVEGADVDITKLTYRWENRGDDEVTDIGVLKSGGQSLPKEAPGRKGRLSAVTAQYKFVTDAPTATLKVWGYD